MSTAPNRFTTAATVVLTSLEFERRNAGKWRQGDWLRLANVVQHVGDDDVGTFCNKALGTAQANATGCASDYAVRF